MSVPTETPAAPHALRSPPLQGYLLLGVGSAVVVTVLLLDRGRERAGWLTMIVALAGLGGLVSQLYTTAMLPRAVSHVAPFAVGLIVAFGAVDYRPAQPRSWETLLLGLGLIGYVLAHFRVAAMTGGLSALPDRPRAWATLPTGRRRRPAPAVGEVVRALAAVLLCQTVGVVTERLIGPASVGGTAERPAGLEFWQLGWSRSLLNSLAIDDAGMSLFLFRTSLVAWFLGVTGFVAAGLFAIRRANTATPLAARLALQDEVWRDTLAEQRKIHRWRLRAARRRSKND